MATLHLICGLPCAGKTTLAKRLERELPALRLAAAEWRVRIVGGSDDPAKSDAVAQTQWDVAVRGVALGVDAILENGFWSRSERDQFRARAAASGTALKWYFLEPPIEELRRRLVRRNAALPADCLYVEPERLDEFAKWWEPPRPDELGDPP